MKKHRLFLILIISTMAAAAYGQGFVNPPVLRIGDLATRQVTYNQVLKYPKIVYNIQGCAVTNFDFTISNKGDQVYGPYKVKGSELTPFIKSTLQRFKGYGSTISIDSVIVTCNGVTSQISDWLEYDCEPAGYINRHYN